MNKINAQNLVLQELKNHNLKGWSFKYDNAFLRLGVCRYRTKTIGLSSTFVLNNTEEEVRNVILHEIAHAIAGIGAGHSRKWRRIATNIGCSFVSRVNKNAVMPERTKIATCPNCGKVCRYYKVRRSLACKACCDKYNNGKYTKEYLFKWS